MGVFGQWRASTLRQKGSISQKAAVVIPARSSPSENPPIPEKRSSTRIGFGLAIPGA